MQLQRLNSRKASLKRIKETLPKLKIYDVIVHTQLDSNMITFQAYSRTPKGDIKHVDIILNMSTTVMTPLGGLGAVGILLDFNTVLGIPNQAHSVYESILEPRQKWNVNKEDEFLKTIFEDDTLISFVKKIKRHLKREYKDATIVYKKNMDLYPKSFGKYYIKMMGIKLDIMKVDVLLETLTRISMLVNGLVDDTE